MLAKNGYVHGITLWDHSHFPTLMVIEYTVGSVQATMHNSILLMTMSHLTAINKQKFLFLTLMVKLRKIYI